MPPGSEGGLITLECKRQAGRIRDVYTSAARWFADGNPIGKGGWQIVGIRLRLTFKPDRIGKSSRIVTIELKSPMGTTCARTRTPIMPWLRNCSGVGEFLDQKQRMNSIGNLCAILASRETTVGGAAFGGCEQLAPWISSGVLVPAGPVATATCIECDAPHMVDVETFGNRAGWYCAKVGFVEPEADSIAAFAVRCEALAELLRLALGFEKRCEFMADRRTSSLDTWSIRVQQVCHRCVLGAECRRPHHFQ